MNVRDSGTGIPESWAACHLDQVSIEGEQGFPFFHCSMAHGSIVAALLDLRGMSQGAAEATATEVMRSSA